MYKIAFLLFHFIKSSQKASCCNTYLMSLWPTYLLMDNITFPYPSKQGQVCLCTAETVPTKTGSYLSKVRKKGR